jgi:hypothetical protein
MDDTTDERSGVERGEAGEGPAGEPFIVPTLAPDTNTQIHETWFKVQDLSTRLDRLEQQMQQVVQDLATINQRVDGISQGMSFHGRAMVAMIADICVQLGFNPLTGLRKE